MSGAAREADLTSADLDELERKMLERSEWGEGPLSTPCLRWTGRADGGGYGSIWLKGRDWKVHRLSFLIANGGPAEQHVLHRCDEPRCHNPEHLWQGSNLDNVRDKIAKGRAPVLRGEATGSVLNTKAVLEIKRLLAEGRQSHREIAARFLVAKPTITAINTGRHWRHVHLEDA